MSRASATKSLKRKLWPWNSEVQHAVTFCEERVTTCWFGARRYWRWKWYRWSDTCGAHAHARVAVPCVHVFKKRQHTEALSMQQSIEKIAWSIGTTGILIFAVLSPLYNLDQWFNYNRNITQSLSVLQVTGKSVLQQSFQNKNSNRKAMSSHSIKVSTSIVDVTTNNSGKRNKWNCPFSL